MARNFMELLRAKWAEGKFVCVGLDTDIYKVPAWFHEIEDLDEEHWQVMAAMVYQYNKRIIEATKDQVCAYKPNTAFYEALGHEGLKALANTCHHIHLVAPDVPIIVDAKRGDIGNTNQGYVRFLFDYLEADATTIHPYLGVEAMKPFLEQKDKGIFVLCRTSNSGSGELQDVRVDVENDAETLSRFLAERLKSLWGNNGNLGAVVGGTFSSEIGELRRHLGGMPLLIPGIGAQGATAEDVVPMAVNSQGEGFIINSSRGIIFASDGEDFAEAAARETKKLTDEINEYRVSLA
jgi:orotidine-5'-phosphate decarboxylase